MKFLVLLIKKQLYDSELVMKIYIGVNTEILVKEDYGLDTIAW